MTIIKLNENNSIFNSDMNESCFLVPLSLLSNMLLLEWQYIEVLQFPLCSGHVYVLQVYDKT